ncbi:gpW family head-tail joining protein [Methylobacterium soli]|uniref:Uncharacterized protein n=1 Tax=Methylobacterium soli TaxID=553447 RepID=A0A6L3T0Z0_9HYPH|nr:gpW family head-tail joining protein [Methylobacterium soli]KAB1079430.1 hypothetical protein F6X53_11545 [Methylobacterium soli]GJE45933.1 hypothetical protein AEGHOMDF_5133 [Methylobacterium soli]
MADTVADLLKLRLWLAEAEQAQHELMIGKKSVSVSYEGKSATFMQANRDDLAIWINTLRQRIATLEGVRIPRRAPIHLSF